MYAQSNVIVVFICLVASQLGNKHQNNTRVSASTVRHSSPHIIIYAFKCIQSGHTVIFSV